MYAGLWMFAWDLADEGIDHVMGWAADSGLSALQIAGAYHAGWFIHPHNPRHRAYMPEDGCVYFHPDERLYERTSLKPKVAATCRQTDWMREAGKRLQQYNLKLVSWTVCTHNTRLGLLHPECTIRNCFGDSYPHALCPANEQVRTYLAALCHDLANNLPLHAVQLESPDYMGLAHGHHHERDLTMLSPLEHMLMDLCFCSACMQQAQAKGIAAEEIRMQVRSILEAGMASAPGRPQGYPRTREDLAAQLPEIAAYQGFRKEVEDTLLHEIKASLQPSGAELWLLGRHTPQIADAVDAFNSCVYGQPAAQVMEATKAARAPLQAQHKLYMGIRLGLNSVKGVEELQEIVQAVQTGGGDGVMFYNYSESPMTALNWIKPALAGLSQAQ